MDSTRTISELKSSFIWAQVRILSETLEPPEGWREYAVETEEGELSEKAADDAVQKLNATLKQHNRIVYSSQAIHHIAQQIASLYWSSVTQETRGLGSYEKGVERSVDLSSSLLHFAASRNIPKLDTEIDDPSASEEQRSRYRRLRNRLAELDSQRQQRQRRLDQLRQLQRLLQPFSEPQRNIQPNLITRDGELMQEIEKMRMLVARAGGRISQRKQSDRNPDAESTSTYPVESEQKLDALLDME